jgi:hypothetical protein
VKLSFSTFSFELAQCIDKYILLRQQASEGMAEDIDPRLQDIVERMFQRCAQDEEYEQAIGIALESRRLDVVKAMVEKGDSAKLLPYVLEVSMTLVQQLEFRNQVRKPACLVFFWLTDTFVLGPSTLGGIVSKLART